MGDVTVAFTGWTGRRRAAPVPRLSRREALEQHEFEDYQRLTDKLYRERPHDPGVRILVGLGTVLMALGLIKTAPE